MKAPLSPRAAMVIVSLGAALATVVAGREPGAAPDLAPGADAASAAPLPVEELDLKKLARERRDEGIPDLFTNPTPPPPPAPPPSAAPVAEKPEPPPAPTAPPLPFSYLGHMKKGERTIVYLLKSQDLVLAEEGQTIATDYRVEGVSDSSVNFVYLPLGTKQVLNVPPRN